MRQAIPSIFLTALAVIGLPTSLWSLPVVAQSGSRVYPSPQSSTQPKPAIGSGRRMVQQAPMALEGYCPVSIVTQRKWVRGDPAYRTVYDGHTYLLSSKEAKAMFDADPTKYVPALGGDCVVAFVMTGKRVPGQIRYAALHDGRLFLLANAAAQKMFLAEPSRYANADLAYGGRCVVCQLGMGQAVPGKPQVAVVYKGIRYLFASEAQRRQFLADPTRYEVKTTAPSVVGPESGTHVPPVGSSSRPTSGSGSGTR